MDFQILGPLEVIERGAPVPLAGGRERTLLAILLLHANGVVSIDRLTDDLWCGRPPPTAEKALQGYVSQLRKALGARPGSDGSGMLETHGRGYVLHVAPGTLDRDRFEQELAVGQAALRAGAPGDAIEVLRDALERWRGPPLADFTYEPFAQAEIARLEQLQLVALEARIDADLELGRHASVVPELETLCAQNPLRERQRAQLMLALYRSGRQAEALAVYRDLRRSLADDLGLEPSEDLQRLEGEILRHARALDAPSDRGSRLRGPRISRRQTAVLVVAALAVNAVAIFAIVRQGTSGADEPTTVLSNSAARIDPASGKVIEAADVPGGVHSVAAEERSVWIASDRSRTLARLARAPSPPRIVRIGGFPSDIACDGGSLWIVDGQAGRLFRVGPDGVVAAATPIRALRRPPRYGSSPAAGDRATVSVGAGAVWVTDGSRRLVKVDSKTGSIVRKARFENRLAGVAAGPRGVWAIDDLATVIRVDSRSLRTLTRVPLAATHGPGAPAPSAIALGGPHVWVLSRNNTEVAQIDPRAGRVLATIRLERGRVPTAIAASKRAAWVANSDGTLTRIDATDRTVTTIRLPRAARMSADDVAVGDGGVWVVTSLLQAEAPH